MAATSGADQAGQHQDSPGKPSAADLPDPNTLAQDWITLWQSELKALGADPEMQHAWQTMAALWAGAMSAMIRAMPRNAGHDRPSRRAGTADAPRPPTAAAAPDPRDAEIDRLARHIAALERRLANLERNGGAAVPAKRRPRRKS
jgi:hypothetical protein